MTNQLIVIGLNCVLLILGQSLLSDKVLVLASELSLFLFCVLTLVVMQMFRVVKPDVVNQMLLSDFISTIRS